MRSFMTEIVHLFLSVPFILTVILVVMTIMAFASRVASGLRFWRWPLIFLTLTLYVVSAPVVSNAVVRWVESRYAQSSPTNHNTAKSPVILVLTAGWLRATEHGYESKISEAGWERTYAAVRLWRAIGGVLVFSGAPTPDGSDSAAAGMARVASQLGVPPSAIRVEPASLNTYENLLFSKKMVEQAGNEFWLITSALQMPRAMAVARRVGIEVIAYPCDYRAAERVDWPSWLPNNAGPEMMEEVIHELLGILFYRLTGRGQ